MKKLLVHLHIYYHEQVDYFISKLRNINNCEWDLVVSCSEPEAKTEEKIREFKPDARFVVVENAGYDLWPFIKLLKSIGEEDYKFVLKLHTKNTSSYLNVINGLKLKGERWRDLLVDSILGSPEQFAKAWSKINSRSDSAFVYACELKRDRSKGMTGIITEAERIGVKNIDGIYVSGTMFLARVKALKTIADADITAEMFAKDVAKSHSRISLAHVYEQLICFAMQDAGYVPLAISTNFKDTVSVKIHRIVSPLLKSIFSLEREGVNDTKVLTILGLKFNFRK